MATEVNIVCPDEETKASVLRNMRQRGWNYPVLCDTPNGILAISLDNGALFYRLDEEVPSNLEIQNLGGA